MRSMTHCYGVPGSGEDGYLSGVDLRRLRVVTERLQDRENGPVVRHINLGPVPGIGGILDLQRFEVEELPHGLEFRLCGVQEAYPYEPVVKARRLIRQIPQLLPNCSSREVRVARN